MRVPGGIVEPGPIESSDIVESSYLAVLKALPVDRNAIDKIRQMEQRRC